MPQFLTKPAISRTLAVAFLLGLVGLGLWMLVVHILAEHHLRQAQQALTRQRYQQALAELREALRFRPGSVELHLLAGRTARQGGNFAAAREHLHRCRELQKGVSADLQLEEYLLRAQTGELDEVYRHVVPYLSQEGPQAPLVLEALSHVYLFSYQFDRAGACLQRWLQLQPDNVEALFLRGNYYSLKLSSESARVDLRRVLDLDPQRLDARLLLAETLKDNHHTEEAVAEYEQVLKQEPSNFAGRLGLASCYVDRKQWPDARPLLEALAGEKPDNPNVRRLRGLIAEGEGRLQEAIHLLEAALTANPSDNSACYHLILCCQRQGDETAAGEYQDRLDRIEKDHKRFLAITNEESGALSSSPALCCELGEICLRLGITRRGLHCLHAALRLDPHYRPAHEQLLRYYEQLGPEGEKQASFHRRQLQSSEPQPSGSGSVPAP